jgi:putative phage-type endonuclease
MTTKEEIVNFLKNTYSLEEQRTAGWFLKRGEMLTASEITKAMNDATPAARHELIMSKLVPKQQNNSSGVGALIWGTRFEPIAKEIYCNHNPGIRILDTTCVQHPVHSFLGASPDGIVITDDTADPRYGKLVEFKCPISRAFDDSTPIPTAYYHQMQMQMECTGLKDCDYVEMKFVQVNYSGWKDARTEFKSWFAVSEDGVVVYKHWNDLRELSEWKNDLNIDMDWQIVFWILVSMRTKYVEKDPSWLETHLPSFQSVWADVQQHRAAGTFPEAPKDKNVLLL